MVGNPKYPGGRQSSGTIVGGIEIHPESLLGLDAITILLLPNMFQSC